MPDPLVLLSSILIEGIILGGFYSLVGLGFSQIFGIMRVMNLAHGDFIILASYLFALFAQVLTNPFLAFIVVAPLMFMIGYLYQNVLNKMIYKDSSAILLITICFGVALENILLLIFTPNPRNLCPSYLLGGIDLLGVSVRKSLLVAFSGSIATFVLLFLFFKRTYIGKAIIAASDDRLTAMLMGINPPKIYRYGMGICMVIAAVTGLMVAINYLFDPSAGTSYLMIAFGTLVIGGIGSLLGTFLGGFVLGISQTLTANLIGTSYQLVGGYIIILIFMLLRPQGLFGRKE